MVLNFKTLDSLLQLVIAGSLKEVPKTYWRQPASSLPVSFIFSLSERLIEFDGRGKIGDKCIAVASNFVRARALALHDSSIAAPPNDDRSHWTRLASYEAAIDRRSWAVPEYLQRRSLILNRI